MALRFLGEDADAWTIYLRVKILRARSPERMVTSGVGMAIATASLRPSLHSERSDIIPFESRRVLKRLSR